MLKQFHIIHFNHVNIVTAQRLFFRIANQLILLDTNKMTLDDPLYFDDGFTPGF